MLIVIALEKTSVTCKATVNKMKDQTSKDGRIGKKDHKANEE